MTPAAIFVILFVALLLSASCNRRRRGCRVNDLSRWKQFGGHLERPAPPPPCNPRRDA